MSAPPIVGVPLFVRRCSGGPSVRMGCPSRCFDRSQAMTVGPSTKLTTSAANIAPPDLKVMYRNRFRSEEHTSELQSLMRISYAVFCLTKKQNKHTKKKK